MGFLIAISFSDELQRRAISEPTLLVSGMVTIVVIIAVIAALSAFLMNEILESRKQSRFIDSVTHELKSPLASLNYSFKPSQEIFLKVRERDYIK